MDFEGGESGQEGGSGVDGGKNQGEVRSQEQGSLIGLNKRE